VLEPKMLAGERRTLAHERLAMTGAARVLVVGLGVAPAADRVGGKVEWPGVARERDPFVAHDAVDPLGDVSAVLEGMRLRRLSEPKHAGARGEREGDGQDQPSREHDEQGPLHRNSRVRDSRTSALVS
jgi:hypothetical protein